jgi:hypothetical protein
MPRERCEDAPCCGHGGVCGRALGMSMEAYESGYDERSDAEIKAEVYRQMAEDEDYEWETS